ncbi:hypothetical protein GCM10010399_35720 [Dactylosporangium fulvum]|uniref:Beta-ketoacyl synthase N-terminal domain-containing protein n=1 Tax=Dactylosporangium fulvum TaxID=53359 RepID=A0ABY5W4R8_9ACTN|nr:hypothetical protein [Dactylosporangium fulvum]UWP84985.1 hypothetical protein Dfulv_12465 [Dactylosporangium fulvum]
MTEPFVVEDLVPLTAEAARTGFAVVAAAGWPEPGDERPPALAGFIHSAFNPLVAAVAGRCLQRRPESASTGDGPPTTGIVLVSALGDVASAAHVAETVDRGGRVGPLFFFQSVPNAVAGHIAARWGLTGPVACVGDTASGLDAARLLLADGDAGEVLLVEVRHDTTGHETAAAVLVADAGGTT